MTAFFHIVNLLFQSITLLFQSSTFTFPPYYRKRPSSYPIPCFYRNLCSKGMDATGRSGNFRGVPSLRSPHGISPTKKDREDMQIISSRSFFHNDFLMARCRPIGHPERKNLPVWGETGALETLSRETSCRYAPCTMGREISPLPSASVEMTGPGHHFIIGGVKYLRSRRRNDGRSRICVIHVFLHSPITSLGVPYSFPLIFSRSFLL